jgi:signal transduction histidine kinase
MRIRNLFSGVGAIRLIYPDLLVRQIIRDFGDKPAARNAIISLRELPPCAADPLLLRRIFRDLIWNALRSSRHRCTPVIEIGYRPDTSGGAYFVCDNGDARETVRSPDEVMMRNLRQQGGRIWIELPPGGGVGVYFRLRGVAE